MLPHPTPVDTHTHTRAKMTSGVPDAEPSGRVLPSRHRRFRVAAAFTHLRCALGHVSVRWAQCLHFPIAKDVTDGADLAQLLWR